MSSSFDNFSLQNSDALQSTLDSTNTSLLDGQNFGHDNYSQSAFDHNSLTETTYQSDSFSTENQWQNTAFHSAPEHSLTQDIDSLLNGSDSSDDSNNPNTTNFMIPTFQHHAHYHPPHEHFQVPFSHEGELQHVASSESCTFHSASDANPYTTVESNGDIRKHVGSDSTGDWVATVHDGKVYNLHNDYLGRAGTDGNVYDEHDKVIGWVDNQGQVFDSAGHHVSDTTSGVVGGAAYLLTIYGGNVA